MTLGVFGAAAVSFLVASRPAEDGQVATTRATSPPPPRRWRPTKGKKSSVAGALTVARHGRRHRHREIRTIVFACDAGMGSSAMGASVLRKKIQAAGHGEVTVVNKAIANLDGQLRPGGHPPGPDRPGPQKTPSAIHVSVDNFMASPRYDEIVELIDQSSAGGAAAVRGRAAGDALEIDVLAGELDRARRHRPRTGTPRSTRPVACWSRAGAVDAAYVDAMHERETVGLHVHGQRAGHPARHQRGEGADPPHRRSRSSATTSRSTGRASRPSS